MTPAERKAADAIASAHQALLDAAAAAAAAGCTGSAVVDSLDTALRCARFALDAVEGRL